jgi:thiol-disulfide isomerase/thioredoxin
MIRKILLVLAVMTVMFTSGITVEAYDNKTHIYFFHAEGCSFCAAETVYLDQLEASDPNLVVHRYEIAFDKANQELIKQLDEILGIKIESAPTLVIGRKLIVGFTKGSTEANITSSLKYFRDNNGKDVIGELLGFAKPGSGVDINPDNSIITLPFFGEVNAKSISLPLLGILLGTLDGFNPCAMWVLLLLISMLFHLEQSWKRWFLGGIFLATTAVMYFSFMLTWLNITVLFGTITYLRWFIAAIALVGGAFNIREYIVTPPGCEVIDDRKRKKISKRIKEIFNQPVFVLATLGVMALAISVNLVELVCSAGLPVLYTQVLSIQNMTGVERILYLLLYLAFFIADDIIIFVIAMKTTQLTGISTKYSRWAHLVGGIVMISLAILMVLKPEWLMLKF